MKNLFFTLVAMLFISTTSFATNGTNFDASIKMNTVCPNEITEVNLNFNSLKDFEAFDSNQLIIESLNECTVSISVTVSVGVGSTYVSVTMTAEGIPCSGVKAKIKELKAAALAAIE